MDLYSLLGVTRAASADEIERAYRRLARRYHPGVNPGDRVAEELYRRLVEAYEVLGDLNRRRDYDQGARVTVTAIEAPATTVSFEGFDFSAPAEGPSAATFSEMFSGVFQHAARRATAPERGGDVETEMTLPFEDAMRGGTFPLSITRQDRCAACGGDGRQARVPMPCVDCQGQGVRRWARGHMVFTAPCDTCGGEGQVSVQPCRACQGLGLQLRGEVVTLTLPPGLEDGARLVVPGRGHAGVQGGIVGDLYVRVHVGAHRVLQRRGRDLFLTLPVGVHEAALGARVDVPTLGEPVRLKIPPGTSSGQTLRLAGRGVPAVSEGEAAGDLLVEIQIVLPPLKDERSRDLLREFGRLNDVDVRRHLFEER
jgi:molecular chaperone DnaJ